MPALEMAYNINDCAELRWGAPEGQRGSRDLQAARACGAASENGGEYRAWFSERRRPPRG